MATGPIDYAGMQAPNNFLQQFSAGLQAGAGARALVAQREAEELARKNAEQYQTDVQAAVASPTPQAFAALAIKYPQQREAFKQSWDTLAEGEKKSQGDAMAQAYSALLAGRTDIAKEVVQSRLDAAKNSGKDFSAESNILKLLDSDPKQAQGALGFTLSHISDPQKFAETFGKIGAEQRAQAMAPSAQREAEAKAGTAESEQVIKAAEAKNAPQRIALELEQKGWDVKKLQEDIRASKEGTRLRAMEVALSKEGNDLKKKELQQKIDEATEKQADKLREKVSTAEAAAASIDNLSSTVDRILKNPSLNDVVGAVEGRIPAITSDESADAIALIDQLGSQAFIAQIPSMKGTGSLTEKEGDKLQASLQNLSRKQSEAQFTANLKEVQRLMTKARDRLSKSTGIPLPGPDRPNAPPKDSDYGSGSAKPGSQQQRNVVVDF